MLTRDSYYLDVATTVLMNLVLTLSLRFERAPASEHGAHLVHGQRRVRLGPPRDPRRVVLWAALAVAPLWRRGAVPVGRIALRVSGPYYFLITFAFLEVARLFFNNFFVDYLGGPSGLVEIPRPHPLPLSGGAIAFTSKLPQYWLMYALFVVVAAVLIRLEYSRVGLVASAIRQRDLLAETLGVDVTRYKLGVFVLGASSPAGRRLLRPLAPGAALERLRPGADGAARRLHGHRRRPLGVVPGRGTLVLSVPPSSSASCTSTRSSPTAWCSWSS